MKTKKKKLPVFRSELEESDYWDKHSLTEHLDEFKPTRLRFERTGPVKHLLSIRIDLDLVRKVRRIAEHKGVPYQTLMHQWLAERAELEAPSVDSGSVYALGCSLGMVRER